MKMKLNMNIIKNKSSKTLSSKEALSGVKKIRWSPKVKSGQRKIEVDK